MIAQSPPALLNLSDLSTRIDIQGFYESHGCAISGKPTRSNEGWEWHSSCPRCPGSTDGFSFWSTGRFSHSLRSKGCGWHGSSPYYFLRDEGYSHMQALEELGIDPSEIGDSYSQQDTPKLPLYLISDEPPCKKWQDQAHAFCHAAEYCLWSDKGETARKYLHSRGFKDDTLKQFHIGLCPDWYKASLSDWGLDASQLGKSDDPQIKVPRGIVIPWYVDGSSIWKVQLRRPDGQYFEILGSSNLLYNVDSIQSDKPVMLVESELDALSVAQESSDLISVVATGGSGKALSGRPIARLNNASFLLQSFDDDEAGDNGAERWMNAFENAERWTPLAHDANEMLKEHISIRSWVEMGLQMITEQGEEKEEWIPEEWVLTQKDEPETKILLPAQPPALPIPEKEQIVPKLNPASWNWMQKNERGLASLCFKCYCPATYWGNQGEPYCRDCCPWANEWPFNIVRKAS